MNMVKNVLLAKPLEGYRTTLIALGMILSGVGQLASWAVAVWQQQSTTHYDVQGALTLIGTGIGLLTAKVHRPKASP